MTSFPAGSSLRSTCLIAAVIALLGPILAVIYRYFGLAPLGEDAVNLFATFYLIAGQEMFVGPVMAMLFLGVAFFKLPSFELPDLSSSRAIGGLAIIAGLLVVLVRFVVFKNYDLTMDEYMPGFQAEIFRSGQLFAPLPEGYFRQVLVLQPFFTYVNAPHEMWGSGYRPVHAALLAMFPAGISVAALHGTLTAVSVFAITDIARRVFPKERSAPFLAVALLLSSPQVLLIAGGGFAFTAHLALNLVWMALFLKGTWPAHIIAALVGALAIGLHQVHVHIFFVVPFGIAMLAGAFGNRLYSIPYIVAYSIALPVWIAWPEISVWIQTGDASVLPSSILQTHYVQDYFEASSTWIEATRKAFGPILLISNVLRLLLWMSPALLLFFVFGPKTWRQAGLVPLLGGASFLLGVVLVHILMPNQMITWGARYYHPYYGCLVVLGMAGFYALREIDPARFETLKGSVAILILAGFVVFLPWRAAQIEQKLAPRAQVQAAIESLETDMVFFNPDESGWFHYDFIRNDPYLRNRPLLGNPEAGLSLPPGVQTKVTLNRDWLSEAGLPKGTYLEPH